VVKEGEIRAGWPNPARASREKDCRISNQPWKISTTGASITGGEGRSTCFRGCFTVARERGAGKYWCVIDKEKSSRHFQ